MQNSEVKMEENNPILHLGVNERKNADSSHSLSAPPVSRPWKPGGHGKAGQVGFWKS